MSFHDCLVIERERDWLIVVGTDTQSLARDVTAEELATCADLMIKHGDLKNPSCVLAPASTSCFFAAVHVGEEIDTRDRAALTYELEDHLPIDAESMVADFVVVPSASDTGKTVASVAVEVRRWNEVAEAFESTGIPVRSIVPAAVLAARSVCQGSNLTDTIVYLFVDDSGCDLVTIRSETIIAWKHIAVELSALKRHRLLDATKPDRIAVVGADETQQAMIQSVYGEIDNITDTLESHFVRGAELALSNQTKRWFELRRDQLGPSDPLRPIQNQLRLVTLAAAACLLAVVIGGWWRTQRIEREIANVRSQQRQLFQEAFPNAKVPGALLRRVQSEHARVMGSHGASSQVDVPQSAPDVLRALLAALPEDVRFRIRSIDILDGRVDLDLQVRSPVDAGTLATSLSSAGFDVKPPVTTQKDAKTFDSVLEAQWSGRAEESVSQGDVSVRVSIQQEVTG